MGFSTVKIIFSVDAEQLRAQFERHAALYKPRIGGTRTFDVEVVPGQSCAAIWSNHRHCPDMYLHPIGHQLGELWMDVRYQDGDSWDLSCHTGFQHELTHRVNPWPYNPEFVYDSQAVRGIEHRIAKLCRLLPEYADTLPPYMQLWRYPVDPNKPKRLLDRVGKAQASDRYGYGDAYQFFDFLRCFGIDLDQPAHTIEVCL